MHIALRSLVSTGAVMTLASTACTTAAPTKVTDVWHDPSYASGQMTNIVVVGARMTDTSRRTLEDGFVAALATHGVRATQSYQLMPDQVPSASDARDALRKGGFDGALVSTPRGTKEQVTVIPGGGFYDYWGPMWAGAPGYVQTDQFVKFETTLWDPRNEKMVWSALTQTENPSSSRDFITSLVKKVIPSMTEAGVIPPARPPGQPVSYAPRLLRD
jgi:hypothetical protein